MKELVVSHKNQKANKRWFLSSWLLTCERRNCNLDTNMLNLALGHGQDRRKH
jgi:hypothetical protein